MKKLKIYLVKTSPSITIVNNECPIPEKNKYFWEPLVLKLIAYKLLERFSDSVEIDIWHIISDKDYCNFTSTLKNNIPDVIAFTEIDVLVNSVNKLSMEIKSISKGYVNKLNTQFGRII
jgi:hypothetical protein